MSGQRLPGERGYTLIEISVAALPFAIIALSLLGAFGFTVRFTLRSEARIDAVRQADLALQVLARELHEASAAPGAIVTWSSDEGAAQDGVAFLSAREDGPGRPFMTDPTGAPRWRNVVYYVHDHLREELRRITDESTTLAPPSEGLAGRVVARQIRHFRVSRQDDLLTISVTIGKPSPETVLQTAIRPRN
jgi:type II secretory pathway pseudopilin PulG